MTEIDSTSIAVRVRALVERRAPRAWRDGPPSDDEPLGHGGLGFDSILLVEILIDCESEFGVSFPETLFDGRPLTLARLIEHATIASQPPTP